eukprot:gene10001-7885_t
MGGAVLPLLVAFALQLCAESFQPKIYVRLQGGGAGRGTLVIEQFSDDGELESGTVSSKGGFDDNAATTICRQLTISSTDAKWDYGTVISNAEFPSLANKDIATSEVR